MLVLAVDIDEQLADFPQHRQIDHLAIDAAHALAVSRQFPANDEQFFRIGLNAQLRDSFPCRMVCGQIEGCLHFRPIAAITHEFRGTAGSPINPSASIMIDLPAPVSPVST